MSSWSLVGSRSWNVRYRPRKIITRSSGPTVYLLYSPVHLLLSVTIPRTKFPEYLYLVSARIENFRNNFVWLKFLLKHGKPQDSPNKINIFFSPLLIPAFLYRHLNNVESATFPLIKRRRSGAKRLIKGYLYEIIVNLDSGKIQFCRRSANVGNRESMEQRDRGKVCRFQKINVK